MKTKITMILLLTLIAGTAFAQEYNINRFGFDSSRGINYLRDSFWVHTNPLWWILDVPNGAIKNGDDVIIVETKTEDGTPYVRYFSVDENIFFGIHNLEESWEKAICVDYYDNEGYKVARIWQNRETPSLFNIHRYFVKFYLPGELEDYEVVSAFGPRPKPIAYYGGPDVDNHRGFDQTVERGTIIRSPIGDSLSIIGYSPTTGKYVMINHTEYFWENFNGQRQTVRRDYNFGFFHLDSWPEELLEKFGENPSRYQALFMRMIIRDAEQILLFLLETDIELLASGIWAPVSLGEEIGTTGWTGKSSGPHIHFEVGLKISGQEEPEYMDPEEFLEKYMMKRELSSYRILKELEEFNTITSE